MAITTVLLDLDGTLVDTTYLHMLAWSRALRDAGEWAPMNAIHRLIGMGADQLLPRLIGRTDSAISDGRARRFAELIDEARPFPGAARLISRLHDEGLTIVLATTSPDDEVEAMLANVPTRALIDHVTTFDDIERSKPDPQIFQIAMSRAGSVAAETVVIGDSVWDIEAAGNCGVAAIAVESGGISRTELRDAAAVFTDVGALETRIGEIGVRAVFAECLDG